VKPLSIIKRNLVIIAVSFLAIAGMVSLGSQVSSFQWDQVVSFSLFPAFILQLIIFGLFVFQWTYVTGWFGEKVGFYKMMVVYSGAAIVEMVTPSMKLGGETTKVVLLKRKAGVPYTKGISIMLLQKLLSSMAFCIALVVSTLLLVTLNNQIPQDLFNILGLSLSVVAAIGVFLGLLVIAYVKIPWLKNQLQNSSIFSKVLHFLNQSWGEVRQHKIPSYKLVIHFSLSIIIWLLFAFTISVLLWGQGMQLDFLLVSVITYLSYLAGMVPFLPGGIGTLDGVLILLLHQSGFEISSAVAVTLGYRVVSYWLLMVFANSCLLVDWIKSKLLVSFRFLIPNLLTMCNLMFGSLGILLTLFYNQKLLGIFGILLAAILDGFDGFAARKLNATSDFGKELDSLCDLVSFGIGPIVVVNTLWSFENPYLLVPSVLYILAGAFRLARYNVSSHQSGFSGLPITLGGIIIALRSLFFPLGYVWVDPLVLVTLSIAMISTISVPRISFPRLSYNKTTVFLDKNTYLQRQHVHVGNLFIKYYRKDPLNICDKLTAEQTWEVSKTGTG
jgi:CDP-diacylglycerol--serine O-phosphatidyltransferase